MAVVTVPHAGPTSNRQELVYRHAERDLRVFIRAAWKIIETQEFVPNWHIDAIADALMAVTLGHVRQLIINIPPRHSKSIITSAMWPAWEWIQWPHIRTIFTSYNEKYLIRDSIHTRRIIESEWYQRRWGDRFNILENTVKRFTNDANGFRELVSFRAGATGGGGDKIVCDDPNDLANQDNIDQLDGDWDVWTGVFRSRVNDPQRGARVIIQQRMSDRDITGRIKEQGGAGWLFLTLPSEFVVKARCFLGSAGARPAPKMPGEPVLVSPWGKLREPVGKFTYVLTDIVDPRQDENEPLNPQRFDAQAIEEIKNGPDGIGEWRFAGQFNQDPVPREGALFPREKWKFFTRPPVNANGFFHADDWLQSWDMAFKELSDSDFVVGTVWFKYRTDYYCVSCSRGRRSVSKTCAAVVDLTNRWPMATRKLVEDKANGPAVVDLLAGQVPGLFLVDPKGGKLARANAVEPLHATGHLWLPDPRGAEWPDVVDGKVIWRPLDVSWVEPFLREVERFPKAANDDQVDSMTQALNYWIPKQRVIGAMPVTVGSGVSGWKVPS